MMSGMTVEGVQGAGARVLRHSLRLLGRALLKLLVLCWWLLTWLTAWTPWIVAVTARTRSDVDWQRRTATELSGLRVDRAYRHPIVRHGRWLDDARELRLQLADRATRGDLWWHLCNPLVGSAIAAAPVALLLEVAWGLVQPLVQSRWGHVVDGAFAWGIPVGSLPMAYVVAGLSLVLAYSVVRWAAPWFVGLHSRWVARVLTTDLADTQSLREEVAALDRSRRTALDLHTAELQRIERNLHDGAQARLVATGMQLAALESLIDRDPAAARALAARLRGVTAETVAEIRALVRGIVPPVLVDRGLFDALRAAAADQPLDVAVSGRYTATLTAPQESAAYFAVAELLTNAAKHSRATRVEVRFDERRGDVRITVQDNGIGGARCEDGGGLDGVRRRLEVFDGHLALDSPPGGPTTVRLRMPVVSPAAGTPVGRHP